MEVEAILTRIADALETSNALAKSARSDYREAQDRQRRDFLRAQERAEKDGAATRRLLNEQAERNEKNLLLHEAELERLRERDAEYHRLLLAAAERSEENLDIFKTATGLAAPDFVPDNLVTVPPDEDESDAEC